MNWLIGIVQSLAAEMVIKQISLFTNARLKGKSLILISDGDNLNADAIRLIKMVTGRDEVPFDWKYQNLPKATFVSFAVLVVTSNLSLANALVGQYDEGFTDRMIEIPFDYVPAKAQAGFKQYLDSNTSALINWALESRIDVLQSQIRAGQWAYATLRNNPLIDFLATYLVEEEKGFVANAQLLDLLDEFLKGNGNSPLSPAMRRKMPQLFLRREM